MAIAPVIDYFYGNNIEKEKYNLESKEYRFFDEKENKYLRTQKYIFHKI